MQPKPIADAFMPDEPSKRVGMFLAIVILLTFTM
jgi:hypothetical protein